MNVYERIGCFRTMRELLIVEIWNLIKSIDTMWLFSNIKFFEKIIIEFSNFGSRNKKANLGNNKQFKSNKNYFIICRTEELLKQMK